jgi:hypothetical protein
MSPIATTAEAFAGVALAAVACDGELANEEIRALRQQLEYRLPYRALSDREMGDLLDRLLTVLRSEGVSALTAQCASLLPAEVRETALAMAASLIHADHIQTPSEHAFLAELGAVLKVADQRAQEIIAVISLLHRDSIAS